MYSRDAMNKARAEVQSVSNTGFYHAMRDILSMELDDARDAVEMATELHEVYRAQGRVAALRSLIRHITPVTPKQGTN